MRLLYVLLLLAVIVVSQETRWATIPSSHTAMLWKSVTLAFVAWFILRSGWGRPATHQAEQRALGTVANTFYEPRREGISSAFTLIGGMAGAMWWGATAWLTLVRGIERKAPARGLVDLEVSVVVGILAGAMAGAAVGLIVGEGWERLHRRRRVARSATAPER
ncbi:MAG TPA: hypothetical protein VFO55_06660 [Gemmatimonadaceae bacterium]|nr:hypothetical protein [Gemmatimonadaceae bacterium]